MSVLSVALSEDGKRVVSGSRDTVRVWDVEAGECLFQGKSLEDYQDAEAKDEFIRNGFWIACADFYFKPGLDEWWKSADGSCMIGKDGNVVIIVAMQEEEEVAKVRV